MRRTLALASVVAVTLLLVSPALGDLPRLHVEGQRILDGAGIRVTLRGTNLGNWLLIEPGVFGGAIGEFNDQESLFSVLRDRFGESERRRLIEVYRDSFITARDFDTVKQFGFNLVRVGFDYELLEDDARPMQLRPDAFKHLDFAVEQAKARGIYVLFDLHGAQERQSAAKPTGREGYNRFWDDLKAQERSLWMWAEIAKHFKGEPTVIGYEALNEPWGKSPEALADYCDRWYARLRPIDADAILVFPGWSNAIKFHGKPADQGQTNAMFDMHFYPGNFGWGSGATPATNVKFLTSGLNEWVRTMQSLDAPLLIGEINVVYKSAGGGEMMRRYYDFAAQHGWPITMWTLKELSPRGGVKDRMWMLTTNAKPLAPVDIRKSSAPEIETAFRSLATMPLVTDPDVLHWLTSNTPPSPLQAEGATTLPAGR